MKTITGKKDVMREIKVRVWNGSEMEYYTIDNNFDCHVGWLEGSILMQFTGLKDSKGQDIYEGDIVVFEYSLSGEEDITVLVSWDEKNMRWDFGNAALANDYYRNIIGNIHENKDLITSKLEKI